MLQGTSALIALLGTLGFILGIFLLFRRLMKKAAEKDALEHALFIRNLPSAEQINKPDSDGLTPLMKAIIHGWDEALEKVFDLSPDVNIEDASGETPIMLAIRFQRLELAKRLQQFGADPATKNKYQQSCLWFAAAHGYKEIFDWLYQFDKELNTIETQMQMTPLMVAGYNGKTEMVNHLLSLGADATIKNSNGKTAAKLAEENLGRNLSPYKDQNRPLYDMIAKLNQYVS